MSDLSLQRVIPPCIFYCSQACMMSMEQETPMDRNGESFGDRDYHWNLLQSIQGSSREK